MYDDWQGLLAAATEEKIVRLFDLATDETYNLSLAGKTPSLSLRITQTYTYIYTYIHTLASHMGLCTGRRSG